MHVMRVDKRMSFAASDQPAVSRESSYACDRKRGDETAPEKRFGKSGVHGARDSQHDEVVNNFHDRDGHRIGRQCEAEGTLDRESSAEQRKDRESIASGKRKSHCHGNRSRVSPTESRPDDHSSDLADCTSRETVNRCAESRAVQRRGLDRMLFRTIIVFMRKRVMRIPCSLRLPGVRFH